MLQSALWLAVRALVIVAVCLVPSFAAASGEVIVDNLDSATSKTGPWGASGAAGFYGRDSVWSRDGAAFTWYVTPVQSGNHEVSMWWTQYASRSTSIPVDIQHSGGTSRVTINQQANGGQWNVLGTYAFIAGQTYAVTIMSQPAPSSTAADAVRFTPTGGDQSPEITSTPVTSGSIGAAYIYQVSASGSPAPLFRLIEPLPDGMTIDTASGLIQWTPAQAGSFDVSVEAYNTAGSDRQMYTITVVAAATVLPDWSQVTRSPFTLAEPADIVNPVLTAADVTDAACDFVADPFMFHENGYWYLFFEASLSATKQGVIGLATSTDGLHWSYDRVVLANPWHNSYPLVFKADGKYYMTPESYTQEAVHLYEAADFPYAWQYVATLVSGRFFVDPTIFRYNGTWWLMVADDSDRNLYLYYSDTLLSGWTEHPKSPVVAGDKSKARPAGRAFVFDNDRLIRVAQKNNIRYGEKVRAFQVDLLTKTEYVEHEIPESPILSPSGSGWRQGGMHQFDPWWTGDSWLVAVDGNHSVANTDDWSIGIFSSSDAAPVITSSPATHAMAGIIYTYDVNSTGNPEPTFSLVPPSPAGMTIDTATGLITWLPSAVGTYNVTAAAENSIGSDTQAFTITVTNASIIDNGDTATSFTGEWSVSGGTNPYGSDSVWSRDGATFTWRFTPSVGGNYQVSMWWTQYASRSASIPVDITHAGGTTRVTINQLINGGQWNVLGTYGFNAGTTYTVKITSQPAPTSTCADAVKFSPSGGSGNMPPVAVIDSIVPNPANVGQAVTFTGHGTDSDGTISGYSWTSSLDGTIGTTAVFSTTTLSAGNHLVSLRVIDDKGFWSDAAAATLQVNGQGDTAEHIYFIILFNSVRDEIEGVIESAGGRKNGDVWTYTNASSGKSFTIHIVEDLEGMRQALYTPDAHIIINGHANYGAGGVFATPEETTTNIIDTLYYADDPRLVAYSSLWIPLSVTGMITGQKYPNWWPVFQDGTSAIMPYDWDDPRGDPPYNYYHTYQVAGDQTHYRVESVHNGALERFPDWSGPAWYSAAGSVPNPANPADRQYYMTNPDTSFEQVGRWLTPWTGTGAYGGGYCAIAAGQGASLVRWHFDIPSAGVYTVSAWWPEDSTLAPNARYTVKHAAGETAVAMDQRTHGGVWNKLGDFSFAADSYVVTLTDAASSGTVAADAIRVVHRDTPSVLDKIVDNLMCPKNHFGYKTVMFRKDPEFDISRFAYKRLLMDTCSSGIYYLDTFHRGFMFMTVNSTNTSGTYQYLKGYLQGKSDADLWADMQAAQPVYDYFNFTKRPSEQ